jgi:hypothetical protein
VHLPVDSPKEGGTWCPMGGPWSSCALPGRCSETWVNPGAPDRYRIEGLWDFAGSQSKKLRGDWAHLAPWVKGQGG